MSSRISILCLLAASLSALGQDHSTHSKLLPATLMSGYSDLHHPVSAKSPEAQKFFDQGLRLIYSFNHDEAARSFRRAAELEPGLAMGYWGIAEAVGPNYNDPADLERFQQAHEAIQKAVDLSATASASDQSYIHAMAKRFPADPKSDLRRAAEEYHDAMREVMKQFPDDPDAATLFAESGMNLHPWGMWHDDGSPEEGTEEIVATLESVLQRYPYHLGAIHYYIHSTEASRHPERALAAANRLPSLAPAAGHIVHMPAHVYIRTGDFESAVLTNQKAAAADQAYIRATGAQGVYPMMYYSHNLHFIAMCASMNGNYAEARRGAELLAANVKPHLKEMPDAEGFITISLAVDIRFHRWNEVLKTPQPDPSMKIMATFWHFSRGMALAATGKASEAEKEAQILAEIERNTPPDLIFAPPVQNTVKDILKLAENVLGAKIALAKNDKEGAIRDLRAAVAIQDTLKYNEPPDWFFPVRESLGGMLLMTGDNAGAERVFREDLNRNPRNPRSLFGLSEALRAQDRKYDASFVEHQFRNSWKGAAGLKVEDLV